MTVPGIVVAGLHQLVTVSCSVQPTAYIDNSELELKWKVVRRHDYAIQLCRYLFLVAHATIS